MAGSEGAPAQQCAGATRRNLFSILTRKVLRRGEFHSRQHLAEKIIEFACDYDDKAKPFRWTYDGRPLKAA